MLAPNSRSVGSERRGQILSDAIASSLASLSKLWTLVFLLDRSGDGGMPGEGYAGRGCSSESLPAFSPAHGPCCRETGWALPPGSRAHACTSSPRDAWLRSRLGQDTVAQ